MKPAVTIIIPNYNGSHLLHRNLPSVLAMAEHYQPGTQVIVVDDGSVDASVSVLTSQFPEVRIVQHETNKGFAEAVLTGVKSAQTELLMLLNSDVQPQLSCLAPLVYYFEFPDTFSVCPLIYEETGDVNRHSWNLREFRSGSLKALSWTHQEAMAQRNSGALLTLYASGGSLLISREKFLALGGFHPLYKPFYGEDYDMGLRAWRRGWKSYFEPRVSVVHQSRGSIKENFQRQRVKRIRKRNKYILEWMHLPVLRLVVTVLPLSCLQILGEILLLDRVNLWGFLTALPRIPAIVKARIEIRATQKYGFNQVLAMTQRE